MTGCNVYKWTVSNVPQWIVWNFSRLHSTEVGGPDAYNGAQRECPNSVLYIALTAASTITNHIFLQLNSKLDVFNWPSNHYGYTICNYICSVYCVVWLKPQKYFAENCHREVVFVVPRVRRFRAFFGINYRPLKTRLLTGPEIPNVNICAMFLGR